MTDTDLNGAVALKLGWTDLFSSNNIGVVEIAGKRMPTDTFNSTVPDYCHSIAAAWEIVEWLHARTNQTQDDPLEFGFRLEVHTETSGDKWVCELPSVTCAPPYEEMDCHAIHIEADTAPLAICLAFLKLP